MRDLDAAVDGLMAAKFRNGGQTCVAEPRLRAGRRLRRVRREAGRARGRAEVAPATDPAAQIGPMINARAVDKIARHVGDARTRRAC
jgi:succinate-semialdehyde dehydrogenase/glutarate-semialdehyde dehydrogenase